MNNRTNRVDDFNTECHPLRVEWFRIMRPNYVQHPHHMVYKHQYLQLWDIQCPLLASEGAASIRVYTHKHNLKDRTGKSVKEIVSQDLKTPQANRSVTP